jgi:hypothetical protein
MIEFLKMFALVFLVSGLLVAAGMWILRKAFGITFEDEERK